ncbi:MAG TPA: ATP-binding cassette domain-containing protein, partial [Oculatellaceae cyanobacterium]
MTPPTTNCQPGTPFMTLAVQNLKKSYNKRPVVNDISFDIQQGEIVGLLGPNGAGKTTTFYSVVGIVKP